MNRDWTHGYRDAWRTLRSGVAWVLIRWALQAFHKRDPVRADVARAILPVVRKAVAAPATDFVPEDQRVRCVDSWDDQHGYECVLCGHRPPPDHGMALVKAVGRGDLDIRVLMLCPDGKGVSVEEYVDVAIVPSRWSCTCEVEHDFSARDCEIQFRRPWRLMPTDRDTTKAPFDGNRVLLHGELTSGARGIVAGSWNRGGAMCGPHWMGGVHHPTHWMPSPGDPRAVTP